MSGKLKRTDIDFDVLSNKISPTEDEIVIQNQNAMSIEEFDYDYLDCAKVGEFVSNAFFTFSLKLRTTAIEINIQWFGLTFNKFLTYLQCNNNNDCCSNLCLGYLKRCVSGYGEH